MNPENYRLYKIIPGGKTEQAWQAFQKELEDHSNAIQRLIKEVGAESCATDRSGIAGLNFKSNPDAVLWRTVPGTMLWMPRAKTNRALYDRMRENVYATKGWEVFQRILGCNEFLMVGMKIMWPMVKDGVLWLPDCTKWEPEDCERITLSEHYEILGK